MVTTAKKIVHSVGMSDLPALYADRAAVWSDLNGRHLYGIYRRIRDEIGTSAAESFVTMVENLKVLSAFNFLNALYALEAKNWVYEPAEENDMGVGPGDTEYIRNMFLVKIGKLPSSKSEHNQPTYFSF